MSVRLMKAEQNKLNLSERLVLYYRKYPVQAAKDLLGLNLIWFQRIALRSMFKHKYILLIFGRGIGKTWLGAVFCCLYAMLYPNTAIGIIAPSFKQAEFVFDKIEELYNNSPYLRAAMHKRVMRTAYKALAKFRNGAFIEGLPLGTGQKVRGRRYNIVWVDEYAYVDETIIKMVVRPFLKVKRKGVENKYIISSTAYYTWNHFYIQYLLYHYMSQIKPDLYAIHEYIDEDVNMVPNPPFELDQEIDEMMRMDTTDELWKMESKCLFPVENVGFFDARMLDRCTPKLTIDHSDSPIETIGDPKGSYVLGVDAARVAGGDNFSISVLKLEGGKKRFVNGYAYNGISYPEMIKNIRRVVQAFPTVQINLDQSGGGTAVRDLLMEPYKLEDGTILPPILDMDDKTTENLVGLRILRLVSFTLPSVTDLYTRLKADFQHTNLLLPVDLRRSPDQELERAGNEIIQTKRELLVLQAENRGAYYTFSVPSQFKKDRATSLALANQAANEVVFGLATKIDTPALATGFWI